MAQLALLWGGLLLSAVLIGIPMVIAYFVWWVIDAFLINGLVEKDAAEKRARIRNEVSLTTRSE